MRPPFATLQFPGWHNLDSPLCFISRAKKFHRGDLVLKRSQGRRSADNKSARCAFKDRARQEKDEERKEKEQKQVTRGRAVFYPVRKQNEYLGQRAGVPGPGSTTSMPILIGAALIAVAILLSTFITALGTRYVGIEGPTEESAWLVDRLTGSLYRCQAPQRGRASCEAEIATGSIEQPKR